MKFENPNFVYVYLTLMVLIPHDIVACIVEWKKYKWRLKEVETREKKKLRFKVYKKL